MAGSLRYIGKNDPRNADPGTIAKKFWPKLAKALAEGKTVENYGGGNDGAIITPKTAPPTTEPLAASITPTGLSLFDLVITGGQAPFTIDPGFGAPIQTEQREITLNYYNAEPGTYQITITDALGATATTSAIVAVFVKLYGPLTAYQTTFWIRDADGAFAIGFNVDDDTAPDVFVPIDDIGNADVTPATLERILKQARERGWPG
jgi:hypothetical protein